MTYQLIYHPLAAKELREAAVWYETEEAGRGAKFLRYLEEKLAYLSRYAESYPLVKGFFREFFIGRYPYVIVYRLRKREKILLILSVFHTSRNPARKYRK